MKKLFGLLVSVVAMLTSLPVFAAAGGEAGGSSMLVTMVPFIIMIVAMYFLLIRPQKKRQKQQANMLDSLIVGDEVVTAGGIMGKIVTIKEDSVVIETGSDRTKIKFEKNSISRVLTIHE